jgi:hypothetical protein
MGEADFKIVGKKKARYSYNFWLLNKKHKLISKDDNDAWIFGFFSSKEINEMRVLNKIKDVYGNLSMIGCEKLKIL